MIAVLAGVAAVLATIGMVEALVAPLLVARFARRTSKSSLVNSSVASEPPISVLKPLHGHDILLEEALATLCRQIYPHWQIVFGVQDPKDPAIEVVQRLRQRFPAVDIDLVIDSTLHGRNRKVGNLINMMPAARHDILVIADADVHVRPDYLSHLAAALAHPGVGLVTTLYAGLPVGGPTASDRIPLAARLGATQITHGFLPSAVLARRLGRADCLGATMCLRRDDLGRIGGLSALVDHLADDNVLGRRISALGLHVALADTVPLTTVPEARLGALFQHELRWARTIRALEPLGFAASAVQYPLAWAAIAIPLSGGARWSCGVFLLTWLLRSVAGLILDRILAPLWAQARGTGNCRSIDVAALAFSCPIWLLPLRDVFSMAVMLASYGGRQVDWRGHYLHADTPPPFARHVTASGAIEETNTR